MVTTYYSLASIIGFWNLNRVQQLDYNYAKALVRFGSSVVDYLHKTLVNISRLSLRLGLTKKPLTIFNAVSQSATDDYSI